MSVRGRPLRFLGLVGGGWISARVLLLWPVTGSLPEAIREILPIPVRSAAAPSGAAVLPRAHEFPGRTVAGGAAPFPALPAAPRGAREDALVQFALLGMVQYQGVPQRLPRRDRLASAPPAIRSLPGLIEAPRRPRLTGSAWFVARSGDEAAGVRLGGSQAGARLRYRLDRADRIAIAARVATPLAGVGREAAIGVEWRPLDAPVAIIAEQRFGFDGARGGPALLAVGGVDAVPVAAGFTLAAYAQAGAVARDRVEPFADGAARITRPIAAIGAVRIDAGLGAWGAAQRGAERIDIGPGVAAAIPVAGRTLRLGLDWRQRIAGNAAPGSGLALSLGADF
ncbi:hypothetical protein [Sphingomonas japonica]|uniref:Haemolysin activator HlyB C-terminal domain-containing protein n=1 Tax=Sphingomonas japonica TaxID=511662 RepID=A0ABX0TYJ7_9SPHN|nr:hypothetical protein [Sphingomonas japonica]NIJ23393.1 hypothetical protein [Sphingomonas japonica]